VNESGFDLIRQGEHAGLPVQDEQAVMKNVPPEHRLDALVVRKITTRDLDSIVLVP
jgi:hypothetical protein